MRSRRTPAPRSDPHNDGAVPLLRLLGTGLSILIVIVACGVALVGFGFRIGPLMASIGGVGVVVGLATQELLGNVVAAVSLVREGGWGAQQGSRGAAGAGRRGSAGSSLCPRPSLHALSDFSAAPAGLCCRRWSCVPAPARTSPRHGCST